MGIGDWGLGIGDCPIPNPQSPIPNLTYLISVFKKSYNIFKSKLLKLIFILIIL